MSNLLSAAEPLPRSPELMSRHDTGLLVVDLQEKVLALIKYRERITWNVRRLIDGARALGVPVVATEQYPKGLGPTVPELAALLPDRPEKLAFSCCGVPDLVERFRKPDLTKVLVAGIETHVCVEQTVFDLMSRGLRVYIAADATGSRHKVDYKTALRRMETGGATITTTEAALFELCEVAGTQEFKEISRLVRESPPE